MKDKASINADYQFLSKYAGFLLQNHLDALVQDSIHRAREEDLPILKQLAHLTEDQIFQLSKRGFAEDILIPLTEGIPFVRVIENIKRWKANSLIIPKDQISGSDITGIYHVRKLSILEMLDHYEYTKKEGKILHQEIENYFNTCINLGYQAYEEIQRGALKESQEILNGILCNMPVIVTRLDKEGNTLKSLGCGLGPLGLQDGDLIGTNVFKEYPDASNTRKAINGEKVAFLGKAKSKSGEERTYQSYFFPEENGAIGFSIDITEQISTEEKLKENEFFLKTIADSTPIIIQVYDRINNAAVYSNKHYSELLGYSSEQITEMGKSITQIVHPDDLSRFFERSRHIDTAKDGEIIESEIRIKHADGSYRWLYSRTTVFKRTPEGKVWQSLSTSIDITDKKKAEERQQQQLRIFDTALSNTVDFNYIFDLEGRLMYVNKPLLDLWGKTMEEALGKNFKELGYPDELARLYDSQIRKVIETKQAVKGENPYSNAEGKQGYYQYVFVPVFNESGNVEAIVGTTHDITELKEAAEKQYKSIFEASNDAILIYDETGCLVEVNPAGYKMHGYTYDEMIGMNGRNFIVQEDHPVFEKFIDVVKEGKNYFGSCRHIRKDGSIVYAEKTGTSFTFRGKPHLLAVVHDFTNRKKAMDALSESEDRFRTLADNIPNLAWITNAEGEIIWLNKRWSEYTGASKEDLKELAWKTIPHPDVLPKLMELWAKSLQTGEPFEMILPLKGVDGIYKSFLSRVIPVKNSMGKTVRWFGTSTDVSEVENKNKELIRINSELDNFIYTASHDLKAPVANIEGLIYTLIDEMPEEDKTNENIKGVLALIQRSIDRFKNTILDLTEVSKAQKILEEDLEVISCEEIIEDARLTIAEEIKKAGAQISVDVSQCNSIRFARKNLQSIVYNLLSNAVKYKDPKKPLSINISSWQEKDFIVLCIQDNGLGISKANQSKLFTMFKRFHDHVEGTGIGLYIVKKIIDNAGGKIEVESEPGKGTTFKVYFRK